MNAKPLRAYLVDDEVLALLRLGKLLRESGRVEIVGSTTDPAEVLKFLSAHEIDVVFLDIQMPGMTGFELLSRLHKQPMVVFTTAYDRFALDAFEVNSIDYLLKPIERERLHKALAKLERLRGTPQALLDAEHLRVAMQELMRPFPERLSSRLGARVVFIEVKNITHFYAKDKLTYAATKAKSYVVDVTISELEQTLDPKVFVRIHRAVLLNIDYADEVGPWIGDSMIVRLKGGKNTELQIARDRLPHVRSRLGF